MDHPYHIQVLRRALGSRVSARALAVITAANLGQDSVFGLVGHPEYHADENRLAETLAYIEHNRRQAVQSAAPEPAWAALGRITHAAQDFYSHSNYVELWIETHAGTGPIPYPDAAKRMDTAHWPAPEAIDGLDPHLLKHPRLRSCKMYYPLEALWLFAPMRALLKRFLPTDSHAWMNLDYPGTGPLFPYSLVAAVQRTVAEFERTLAAIGEERGRAGMRAFAGGTAAPA